MRKRFGVLLTLAVLAVLVCGLSVAVAAEDTDTVYDVYVGNVGMSDGDYLASGAESVTTTRPASGGYAYYEDGVLTLNGFAYTATGEEENGLISTEDNMTVRLVGVNTLTGKTSEDYVNAFYTDGNLTVEGAGTLNIKDFYIGLLSMGGITISSGTVTITAESNGIFAVDNVTISGGTVEIDAENIGISTGENGDVTISGGTVNITVEKKGEVNNTGGGYVQPCEGIHAHNVTISGGTTNITAHQGITADQGNATISGGTVNITANIITGQHWGRHGINAAVVRITNGNVYINIDDFNSNVGDSAIGGNQNQTLDIAADLVVTVPGCVRDDCNAENGGHSLDCIKKSKNVTIKSPIFVGGAKLADGESNTAGTATYKDGVLTLNGFTYSGKGDVYGEDNTYTSAIYTGVPLTIELLGINTIVNDAASGNGITGYGDITIKGTGSLSVTAKNNGIDAAHGNVTISGGAVTIDAGDNGINADGVTISGGTVDIDAYIGAESYGINANDVTISGGAVNITTSRGIIADRDNVTISGGKVNISAEVNGISAYRGIAAGGDITISDGTVMIDAEHGIIAYHDNVTISGGTVTIDAKNGIYAGNVVRFTGGSLDITCYGLPVKAVNGIEIDDSLLPDGVTIEQKDGSYILVSESGTSIRIGSGAAATNYFGKVIRSMQTISFPGVPELDGLWRAFGSTINLTKITPEPRDGYTFTGWYADEACTKPITKIVVTGNMQLFAGWEEIAEEEEAEETGTAEAAG